jgi:hypothetical protein
MSFVTALILFKMKSFGLTFYVILAFINKLKYLLEQKGLFLMCWRSAPHVVYDMLRSELATKRRK